MRNTRPSDIRVEPWTARAKRGPDEAGCWYWEARATKAGKRVTEVLGWRSRPDALRALQAIATAVDDGPLPGSIAELVDMYQADIDRRASARAAIVAQGAVPARGKRLPGIGPRTAEHYEHHLVHIREVLGNRQRSTLSASTYEVLQLELYRRGWASTSVDICCGVLRAAWRWGVDQGLVQRTPVRYHLQGQPEAKREPTAADIEAVLGKLDGWHLLYVQVLAGTGMRVSEVQTLEERDVDLDERVIRLRWVPGQTKTPPRSVPVPTWLRPHLEAALTGEASRRLFPKSAAHTIGAKLRELGWRPKDLRDAAVTAWETSGAPSWVIDGALGNSEAVRKRRYGRHPDEAAVQWADVAAPGTAPAPKTDGKVVNLDDARRRR